MKVVENVTIYRCEFCAKPKTYLRKNAAARHEKMCSANPANHRKCFDCQFLKKEPALVQKQNGRELEVNVFYCSKIGAYLYPPRVEHKGNAFIVDEAENVPMKTECQFHKEIELFEAFRNILSKDVPFKNNHESKNNKHIK